MRGRSLSLFARLRLRVARWWNRLCWRSMTFGGRCEIACRFMDDGRRSVEPEPSDIATGWRVVDHPETDSDCITITEWRGEGESDVYVV